MRNVTICTLHQINLLLVIKSRRMRWAGHVVRMCKISVYRIWLKSLKEETTQKTLAGRINIKMDLIKARREEVDWILLA
jgi:hypothetical protein